MTKEIRRLEIRSSESGFAAFHWAHLDTTTKPAFDSLSPRRRSGERVREGRFQKSATIRWNEPLSPALSPLVPRRERGHFSDDGCIKMRPRGYALSLWPGFLAQHDASINSVRDRKSTRLNSSHITISY